MNSMNTNTEEWGNIELPGLSDEELFKKNWNYVAAGQDRANNPKWRENNLKANQNRKERLGPEYSKRVSDAQRLRYDNMSEEERREMSIRSKTVWEDPEFVEKMKAFYSSPEQIEKHTKQVREVAKRSDWKEKVKILNKEKRKNSEHIKRHQEAIDKRTQDPEWRKKQAQRSKPLVTPNGIFPSRKDAAAFYQVQTPVMNDRMKRYPNEYYYISHEEYIMLTGKDI